MLTVILLTVMVTGMLASVPHYDEQNKLRNHLFRDYDKDILPKPSNDQNVTVNFGLILSHVTEFDQEKEEVTFNFWGDFGWTDARLTWDPAAYGGISSIRVPASKLWVPDLSTYSGVHDSDYFFVQRGVDTGALATVSSNGAVVFMPPMCMRLRCKMEDAGDGAVKCSIKVGSWTYDAFNVDPRVKPPGKINMHHYYDKKVQILDSTLHRYNKVYDCCPEPYPYILVNVTMKSI